MKYFLALLLSGSCWAHPLSWMAGSYHGNLEGSRLEETWTDSGSELLGTTVWLEEGQITLRELARIRPSKGGYDLDLWLTFADGKSKHLRMKGRLETPERLVFRDPKTTLTFQSAPQGELRVELQKQSLTVFQLKAGTNQAPALPTSGRYVLHTYLGDHVFEDELNWTPEGGTLSVPGKFSSPLENRKPIPGGMSFEILVPEGSQPYRVRYQMRFNPDFGQATGTLVNLSTGQTMGSFVAIKKDYFPQ